MSLAYLTGAILAPFTDGTNSSNMLPISTTTTAASAAIPAGWKGQYWMFEAVGDDIWILFTVTAATATNVDKTKTSRDKAAGLRLLAGQVYHLLVPNDAKFISYQSQNANATLLVLNTNRSDPTK